MEMRNGEGRAEGMLGDPVQLLRPHAVVTVAVGAEIEQGAVGRPLGIGMGIRRCEHANPLGLRRRAVGNEWSNVNREIGGGAMGAESQPLAVRRNRPWEVVQVRSSEVVPFLAGGGVQDADGDAGGFARDQAQLAIGRPEPEQAVGTEAAGGTTVRYCV